MVSDLNQPDVRPIGVFDSGVGGLSVLREIRKQHPNENLIYFADQANVPYGPRSLAEVRVFSEAIVRYLLAQGAKMIIVACNTASAAALYHLRETFPDVPFVGMEPAVKPAAESTESGVVGVLATFATFQGELYASVVDRFAQDVQVLQSPCAGLVDEIEAGRLHAGIAEEILRQELEPMLARGIDRVVLGCTHYPFAIPIIKEIVGDGVKVIDPAPAIGRQVGRLLDQNSLRNGGGEGEIQYLTSGDAKQYQALIKALLGEDVVADRVLISETEK